MNNITYHVPSIHCMHCAHTIKMELGELPGVSQVDVDVDKKEVAISFDDPATTEKIEDLLAEINYLVEK